MKPIRFKFGQPVICTDPNWRPVGHEDKGPTPIGQVYHVAQFFKQEARWYITIQELNKRFCYSRKHFAHATNALTISNSLAIGMQPTLISKVQATPNRMSSREVAELTGKDHSNVMRDIRALANTLQNSNLNFVCETTSYVGANGQMYEMYQLDKETTICLLTGYDAVARMKVIQRWQALENQGPNLVIPKTLSQALLLAAHQAEQVEQLQLQVAQQQTAVDFFSQVGESNDAIPVGEAAKLLGVGPQKLFVFLRSARIFMNGTGGQHRNMPYQQHLDEGRFTVVEKPYQTPDGKTHINVKPLVTQKGLEYIRKRLSVSL